MDAAGVAADRAAGRPATGWSGTLGRAARRTWRRRVRRRNGSGRRVGPGGRGGMGGFGSNAAFENLLVNELIPYVDANFRTIADQPHRGMAGLSMGGMETHSITLEHLDVFSHIGLFSGGVISPG